MKWWEVAPFVFNVGMIVGWYLERKRRDADAFRLGVACSKVLNSAQFDRLMKAIVSVDEEAEAKRSWWCPW